MLKSAKNGLGTTVQWLDSSGAQITTEMQARNGFEVTERNSVAEQQLENIRRSRDAVTSLTAPLPDSEYDSSDDNNSQKLKYEILQENRGIETWKICEDIQSLFLERNYKKELEYYSRYLKLSGEPDLIASVNENGATEGVWAAQATSENTAVGTSDAVTDSEIQISDYHVALEYLSESELSGGAKTDDVKEAVEQGVEQFLSDAVDALKSLNIDSENENFITITKEIVYAAACAATAEKEYSAKYHSTDWLPDSNYYGTVSGQIQDTTAKTLAHSVDEAVDNATEFGIFKIKLYNPKELVNITGEELVSESAGDDLDKTESVNVTHRLIDPAYRNSDTNEIADYKKKCIKSPAAATVAYLRIALYWLIKLHQCHAFPNINNDIMSNFSDMEENTVETMLKSSKLARTAQVLATNIKVFKDRRYVYDLGKIWAGCILASTDGNSLIRERITDRDYRALNSFIEGASNPESRIDISDSATLIVRKMILALVGQKRIKDIDARERMLRAFPTYYMALIDEGREIGLWKLHDNFYNSMAISSMEVVKSRKIPADTAIIVMSNFYQQFSTEDEDYRRYTQVDYADVFESIFSPTSYGEKLEPKSLNPPMQHLIRLRPGARVHLRMGYGSNASMLPVVFNGVIAEVSALDTVEIVAQGDGIELTNPIYDDEEAHQIIHKDDVLQGWFTNGGTPRQIMNGILTTHGGILSDFVHENNTPDFLKGLFNRNPYGIYHFGNPRFTAITKSGEITQNIFEAVSKPAWGTDNDISAKYGDNDAPHITFDMFQKTVWDCANICTSVSPDYVCAVAPFDYRSTLFIGHPRYYYAYGYTTANDAIIEKRKPFQQFHIFTSATDIISNGIIASRSQMKTAAIGLYQVAGSGNYHVQEKVGPLFADIDIYPEDQKTMIVDTQLWGKGIPVIGKITNSFTNQALDWLFDDKGSVVSHEKIAWRMTASALKNSVKDMYQGDLIVIGDPTVKPHDRLMIADQYSGISGQCTVKEVIMRISVDEGFITTISPDCINVVDDRFEMAVYSWSNAVARVAATSALTAWAFTKGIRYQGQGTTAMLKDLYTKFMPENSTRGKLASQIAESTQGLRERAAKVVKDLGVQSEKLLNGRTLLKILKSAGGITAGAGLAVAAAPAAVAAIAALVGSAVLGEYTSHLIARAAKNWQVLQIFPLKRYGMAWTAGLTGSKGLVVGSPTYNEQGLLESIFSEIIQSSASDDVSKILGGNDISERFKGILGLVIGIFNIDEIKQIAQKYDIEQNIIDEDGNATMSVESHSRYLKAMIGKSNDLPNDFRRMLIAPRVKYSSDDVQKVYDYYAMLDVEQAYNDPKLEHNLFVSGDGRLKKYIDNGFFRIVHETPGLNKGKSVETQVFIRRGNRHYVKTVSYRDSKSNAVLDIPMLNKDALNVLYEIVKRTKNNMPSSKSSDKLETWDFAKTSFIMLESALRIGDKESPAATGFVFVIEASTGITLNAMNVAIRSIQDDIDKLSDENELFNDELFKISGVGGNKVAVTVLMPQLSQEQLSEGDSE